MQNFSSDSVQTTYYHHYRQIWTKYFFLDLRNYIRYTRHYLEKCYKSTSILANKWVCMFLQLIAFNNFDNVCASIGHIMLFYARCTLYTVIKLFGYKKGVWGSRIRILRLITWGNVYISLIVIKLKRMSISHTNRVFTLKSVIIFV